jgi:nucleotide-binding universal stress UspA family protein
MFVIYPVVVLGTDGSDFARGAEGAAATTALACEARLIVVCVADDHAHGRTTADRAAATARAKGLADADIEVEIVSGSPVHAIVEIADRQGAGLIVLGSRGLSMGTSIVGSVASGVAHHGSCDVLLVGAREDVDLKDADKPHDYRRILVATDGSPTADRAADRGSQLSERFASEVIMLFVGHPKTGELVLKDTASSFGPHFEAKLRNEQGDPAETIVRVADDEGAGLIVIGNKGLTGVRGRFLGSVPKRVTELATHDVLVVRTVTQSLGDIGNGEGGLVEIGGDVVAVYRDQAGTLHHLNPKCTHMGCTVGWNNADKTWDCPCHGSRYAPDGDVIHGPAKKALSKTD